MDGIVTMTTKHKSLLFAAVILLTQTGCVPAIVPAIGQMLMQIQMIVYGPFKVVPEWLHKLFLLFE